MAEKVLNEDGTLSSQFKDQLTGIVNGLMETEEVQYSNVVKEYVEGQLNSIENKLLNNAQWTQVKSNIDAILEVFDANKDGSLNPAEILSKFGELKNSVDGNVKSVAAVATKLESNVKELTGGIAANANQIKNVSTQVAKLSADVASKVETAKKDANAFVTAVKTELGGKLTTVEGAVKQVEDKVQSTEDGIKMTVGAIADIAEAFQTAAKSIDTRLNKAREVFGLATSKVSGDGDVL